MGDVLPISALLSATPLADPTAASSPATALPTGAEVDPFADLLAVVGGAQGAVAMAIPALAAARVAPPVIPVATTDADAASPSIDTGDEPTADLPKKDGDGLDDKLAATLSAMLALAPPPPPPPALAAPVRVVSSEMPETKGVPAEPKAAPIAVASAAAVSAVAVSTMTARAAVPQATQPDAPKVDIDQPTQAAGASADAPDQAGSAKTDDPAAKTDPSAKPAPALPAAILRMLREAHATTALSSPPAVPANPIGPVVAAEAPAAPAAAAAAPASRDAAPVSRRDARPATTRATSTATSRAAQQRAPRAAANAERVAGDVTALPFADLRQPNAANDTPAPSPTDGGMVDSLVQKQLSIAQDGKWLDSLARDIAASTNGSDLHFKLNPENLGSLTVSLVAQADGTAIRMTADTDHARAILTDAQPRLIAEARAQGLRVSETHVELNNNSSSSGSGSSAWNQAGGQAQAQGERRSQTSSPNHLPFEPTRSEEAVEAPVAGTSERYA